MLITSVEGNVMNSRNRGLDADPSPKKISAIVVK